MSAESRAEKKAKKASMKTQKQESRYGEKITDAYDESDRSISVEDAHRDVVYTLPSTLKQVAFCFNIQMKRFTKQRTVYIMLLLLALMPIVFFIFKLSADIDPLADVININEYIATFLVLLPVLGVLISSIICGAMLPQEFNERTVYLSLPLPMSRKAFYYGKFLSGFVLAVGVVSAAYGIAILISMMYTTTGYTGEIFKSLWLSICGVFFTCSFAYMLSSRSKRGSSMKPFIMVFILIPGIAVAFDYLAFKLDIGALQTIASYFPTFTFDLGLAHLGVPTSGIPYVGLTNLVNTFVSGFGFKVPCGSNDIVMSLVAIILGIVCLILGMKRISRRDM